MPAKTLWIFSVIVSALFFSLIALLWYQKHTEVLATDSQMIDANAANAYLQKNWEQGQNAFLNEPTVHIPTGVFIKSLKFLNSNEVEVSGLLWQKYPQDDTDSIGIWHSHYHTLR